MLWVRGTCTVTHLILLMISVPSQYVVPERRVGRYQMQQDDLQYQEYNQYNQPFSVSAHFSYHSTCWPIPRSAAFTSSSWPTRASKIPMPTVLKHRVGDSGWGCPALPQAF